MHAGFQLSQRNDCTGAQVEQWQRQKINQTRVFRAQVRQCSRFFPNCFQDKAMVNTFRRILLPAKRALTDFHTHARILEFACTRRPVLGTLALASSAAAENTASRRSSAGSPAGGLPRSSADPGFAPVCAWVRWDADFHDILTEADVCTRLSAPAANSTGWRPET
jgi:hypothetical protein